MYKVNIFVYSPTPLTLPSLNQLEKTHMCLIEFLIWWTKQENFLLSLLCNCIQMQAIKLRSAANANLAAPRSLVLVQWRLVYCDVDWTYSPLLIGGVCIPRSAGVACLVVDLMLMSTLVYTFCLNLYHWFVIAEQLTVGCLVGISLCHVRYTGSKFISYCV